MNEKHDAEESDSFVEYVHRMQRYLSSTLSRRPEQPVPAFRENIPKITDRKLEESWSDHALRLDPTAPTADTLAEIKHRKETILYLAYGSNLSHKTFQKKRGIRPLAQVNVVVPELKLTFDLPGIPYSEPCFANTARRDPSSSSSSLQDHMSNAPNGKISAPSETDSLLRSPTGSTKQEYHKDRWHKGLVGVVYEVTPMDYAHIIATEGGGSSYTDILVTSYVLPDNDETVPSHPTGRSFRAHTLFSPASNSRKPHEEETAATSPLPHAEQSFTGLQSDSSNSTSSLSSASASNTRLHRPNTSYAQPSARYLKLLTDGADEHALPTEYKRYLQQIRPYRKTHQSQLVGAFIFMAIWLPVVASLFAMITIFQNDKGRSPPWLTAYSSAVFKAVWKSYDLFFKPLFGDGERTVEDNDDDDDHHHQEEGKENIIGNGSVQGNGTIVGPRTRPVSGGEKGAIF